MRVLLVLFAVLACDASRTCPESTMLPPAREIEGCCDPSRAEFIVDASGSLPPPTAELNFYRLAFKNPGEVRLPSVEKVGYSQTLYLINVGAPIDVFAPAGAEINGVFAGVPWVRLKPTLGLLVRRQNTNAFAGVQGEAP